MAAGDEFGVLVPAIVHQRFVESTETRARVGEDVLESQGLDDVHHEVGAGAIGGEHLDIRYGTGIGFLREDRSGAIARRLRLLGSGGTLGGNQGSRATRGALQKIATANRKLSRFRHDISAFTVV